MPIVGYKKKEFRLCMFFGHVDKRKKKPQIYIIKEDLVRYRNKRQNGNVKRFYSAHQNFEITGQVKLSLHHRVPRIFRPQTLDFMDLH